MDFIAPEDLKARAASARSSQKKLLDKLKKSKPAGLDEEFNRLHEEAFSHINCLDCGNCCKTTGPLFTTRDIERLAALFKIKPAAFIEKYLHVDEDNDYVLNVLPCPFLGLGNFCTVYDDRPNACRQYPHTNQRKMHLIFKETLNNAAICPAVFNILERMKQLAESS